MKPVIGMIAAANPKLLAGRHLINTSYVRAVIAAGGTPLLIPADEHPERAEEYMPLLHGLLVPGGEDVTPALYGEDPVPQGDVRQRGQGPDGDGAGLRRRSGGSPSSASAGACSF